MTAAALWTWQFDLLCAPFVLAALGWIAWKYRRDPEAFMRWFGDE